MGRWDWLYERRAQPIKEWILDRYAEQVAQDLRAWPPPILAFETEAAEKKLRPILEGPRPSDEVVRLGLMLARLGFEHREEEIDGILKSGAWRAYAKTDAEREVALFLERWFFDRALDLKEHAEGAHLKYADLADLMARIERRLFWVTLS